MTLPRADRPTMYFVGVTTGQSSINRVFRAWAPALGNADAQLAGVDLAPGSPAGAYRDVVSAIHSEPLGVGALVTTHKIDIFLAAHDLFDGLNPDAQALGEISCIAKDGPRLIGLALDPITSGLALEAFLPRGHWEQTGATALLFGAGGSATALMCYLADARRGADRPSRIVVSSRRRERLDKIAGVHAARGYDVPLETVQVGHDCSNDELLAAQPAESLVVNATGLGKDAPGSPLSGAAVFPRHAYVWDFNYRGDLVFLDQARRQAAERELQIEDGWIYFIHGWTRAIAEAFHIEIPTAGPEFNRLAELAKEAR